MKTKKWLAVLVCLVYVLCFAGCSIENKLIGEWIHEIGAYVGGRYQTTFDFKSDGTVDFWNNPVFWRIDGDKIILEDPQVPWWSVEFEYSIKGFGKNSSLYLDGKRYIRSDIYFSR